jgi:hypothetical protein
MKQIFDLLKVSPPAMSRKFNGGESVVPSSDITFGSLMYRV